MTSEHTTQFISASVEVRSQAMIETVLLADRPLGELEEGFGGVYCTSISCSKYISTVDDL